jgi:hypothetical protein
MTNLFSKTCLVAVALAALFAVPDSYARVHDAPESVIRCVYENGSSVSSYDDWFMYQAIHYAKHQSASSDGERRLYTRLARSLNDCDEYLARLRDDEEPFQHSKGTQSEIEGAVTGLLSSLLGEETSSDLGEAAAGAIGDPNARMKMKLFEEIVGKSMGDAFDEIQAWVEDL